MKDKEIIKQELLDAINGFYKEYSFPPMNINDKVWDNLLNILEAHFLVHQIMNDYEYALNIIIRRALYFSQRNEAKEFTVEHLSRALNDLVAFHIPQDEIDAIKEELNEKNNILTK